MLEQIGPPYQQKIVKPPDFAISPDNIETINVVKDPQWPPLVSKTLMQVKLYQNVTLNASDLNMASALPLHSDPSHLTISCLFWLVICNMELCTKKKTPWK